MLLLGLDIGTTGCKAAVFTEDGKLLGEGFREYAVDTGGDGKAEQDPEKVWNMAKEVIIQAVSLSKRAGEVGALSISVQGDAIIPLDSNHKPVHKAILGMDYRSRSQAEKCAEIFGDKNLFMMTGMRPHPMNSLTKILYFRENFKDEYNKAETITTYADYILGKLGAPGVIDYTMASRTMAFDLEKKEWSVKILNKLDIDPGIFSKAVPTGTPVGEIDKELAGNLGLPENTVLVSGAHDQPCNALGSGVIETGHGVVTTGTAEVFSTVFSDVKISNAIYESYYPCYMGILPDQFFTFSLNHTGGLLLKWFRDEFCGIDKEYAEKNGLSVFKYLDSKMPKNPTKLFMLPHFNGSGTPWSDMDSRGAIVGLGLNTTRYDIVRAILESLTYELSINIDVMESAGIGVEIINAAGGGARSPQWLQIKADILNRPIQTTGIEEAGCLGAAIIAGTGTGVYSSFEEGVKRSVKVKNIYYPDEKNVKIYKRKQDIYRDLYPALKTINKRMK